MHADQAALDEPTLERLYQRLERPLFNVVYRLLWSRAESQDVVQEAFVRLWGMRERVRMESVDPLLYRIAMNAARSRLRRQRVWRWVSLDALHHRASPDPDAEAVAAAEAEAARLRSAVDGLPADLRDVVVLCELSELTYEQVAQALGIAVGTVGSRRHRGLTLLRRELGED